MAKSLVTEAKTYRTFSGVRYKLSSYVIDHKNDAKRRADKLRGEGHKVRVVKVVGGYILYVK